MCGTSINISTNMKRLFLGNGYIEGNELDSFLREFVSSVNATDCGPEVRLTEFIDLFTDV